MTTFDKLKGAAATLADAAVKTTGDLAQKGKKQMDLLALENKLSRAQRQLGALVYALHKNGEENTALVERYIETIAAVEKDIAALEPAPAAAPLWGRGAPPAPPPWQTMHRRLSTAPSAARR